MTPSRTWWIAVMLAPALAAAQPGPDDTRRSPAPSFDGPPGAYTPIAQPFVQPAQPRTVDRADRKDPNTAGMTSLLVTSAGFGLVLVGAKMNQSSEYNTGTESGGAAAVTTVGALAFLVGPTTGHVYAGHTWNTGLGLRLASLAAVVAGAASCANDGCDDGNGGAAAALIIGGALGFGIGTVYEIATAPQAARDYNHEHGLDVQLSVLPLRDARSATSPGVGLVGRF